MKKTDIKSHVHEAREKIYLFEQKHYSMVQILKQNKWNFTLLGVWFYLGAVLDMVVSFIGFLTIGIEYEGNPRVVEAWYGNFLLFEIEFLTRKVVPTVIFLYCVLVFVYLLLNFNSKKALALKWWVIILGLLYAYISMKHWQMVLMWSFMIITNAPTMSPLSNEILYLSSTFMTALIFILCLSVSLNYMRKMDGSKIFNLEI